MNEIIKAEHLTKIFGDQKAVDNLSFTVHRGETLGLLGPNGAGKTTTIKMLIGLIKPTRGGAIIGGYNVQQKPIEAKELFGISPQELSSDHHLSLIVDLYFYVRLYGLSRKEAKERYILDLKERGKTIILTTHYLEEAEMLCHRVIIIDYSIKIAEGTPDELKHILKVENILTIKPRNSISLRVIEEIKEFTGVEDAIWHDSSLKIYLKDEYVLELIISLILKDAGILEMDIKRASLEDVFLHLTGKELRE